jgi:hypothetical protein
LQSSQPDFSQLMSKPKNPSTTATARAGGAAKPRKKPASTKEHPEISTGFWGIGSLADSLRVSEEFAVAVTCSILTGLAGPDPVLQGPFGCVTLPKLDLLTDASLASNRLIECLSGPLQRISRRLTQNMGRSNPEAIEHLTVGSFAAKGAKKGHREGRGATLRLNLEILVPPTSSLAGDLVFDPLVQRSEAILHPQVLVRNASGRDVPVLVEECHLRHALVIQPKLGLDRAGSEPSQVIAGFLPLLDGMLTKAHAGRGGDARNCSEPAKAQMILTEDLSAITDPVGHLLNRLLVVSAGKDRGKPSKGSAETSAFFEAFQSALEDIIELRREGHTLMARFDSEETLERFQDEQRTYETEVAALRSRPGVSVIGLPMTLFWGMHFLRHALPDEHRNTDKELVTAAFAYARRLATFHDDRVSSLRNANLDAAALNIARRWVEKLAAHSTPLKPRELLRCFKQQKRSRYAPILDALVEAEVLIQDEEDCYSLGAVDLEDVVDAVVRKIGESRM